jgi:mRNA interferase RelE/StbE
LHKTASARVMARIEGLASDPLPSRVVKLSDAGGLYRIREGEYRIVYEVDAEAGQVTIHYVRHRRDVYRAI